MNICLFCEKKEVKNKFCSYTCNSLYQWREYRRIQREKEARTINWIGKRWEEYHRLPTKKQIIMLDKFKKIMQRDVLVNNKKI